MCVLNWYIGFAQIGFRFVANMKPETYEDGIAVNTVLHTPVGVVGLITPWNLPLCA